MVGNGRERERERERELSMELMSPYASLLVYAYSTVRLLYLWLFF